MAAAQRREALLDAAARVMARGGLAAGTTRAVVAEAGMALASFHYAFTGRDQLLADLVQRVLSRELTAVAQPVRPGDTAVDVLRRAGRGYLAHLAAEPDGELFMLELTVHAARDPALRELAAAQYAAYRAMAAGLLTRAATETGTIWRADPADLAGLLVAVLDGLTAGWLVDRDTDAARATLDAAVELFVAAHAAPR